jgi:hypothetical protein
MLCLHDRFLLRLHDRQKDYQVSLMDLFSEFSSRRLQLNLLGAAHKIRIAVSFA